MKLLNYDSKQKSQKDYRQLVPFIGEDYRMLISGPSGCGKTNTLMNLIQNPLVYYDKIYLYANNTHQDKYVNLVDLMDGVSERIGYNVLEVGSGYDIIDVEDYPSYNRKIVVFDDLIRASKGIEDKVVKYFIGGRHRKISPIYLSEEYHETPKLIRANCTHMIIYPPDNETHRRLISKENRFDVNKFECLKEYDFIFRDKKRKAVNKNFDEFI